MAKLPGGGGSGRRDRARNAGRSLGHVLVVRVSSAELSSLELNEAGPLDLQTCITPTLRPLNTGAAACVPMARAAESDTRSP